MSPLRQVLELVYLTALSTPHSLPLESVGKMILSGWPLTQAAGKQEAEREGGREREREEGRKGGRKP